MLLQGGSTKRDKAFEVEPTVNREVYNFMPKAVAFRL